MSHPHEEAQQREAQTGDVPLSDGNGLDSLIKQASPNIDKTPSGDTSATPAAVDPPLVDPASPPVKEVTPASQETPSGDTKVVAPAAKPEVPKKAVPANPLEKQVAGLAKWNQKLSQQNTALIQKVELLAQKIDGTEPEPPAAPTKEALQKAARFDALEEVSRARATEKHGQEFVDSQIYDDGAPYLQLIRDKPWIHQEVLASKDPTETALRAVAFEQFYEKFGSDPVVIEQTMTETIRAQIMAELKGSNGIKKLGDKPPDLSGITSPDVDTGKPKVTPFTLSSINPGFQ